MQDLLRRYGTSLTAFFLILTAFAPTIWIAFGLLILRGLLSQMDVLHPTYIVCA